MKRYLAIFGFVFIGVIAGLLVRGIPIVLQVQAGGGIPQTDRNGDVNGDARLDMSDAIYLLLHIFRDGPQPVAFAQAEPADLGALEAAIDRLSNTLPCKDRPDRFIDNANETFTDQCTGLMWPKRSISSARRSWVQAIQDCSNLEFAAHNDWRLPTAMELKSIINRDFERGLSPVIIPATTDLWTSDDSDYAGNMAYVAKAQNSQYHIAYRLFESKPKADDETHHFLPVRTAQ